MKQRNRVRSARKDKREELKFAFAIEELKGKKPLGNLSLFNCNWVDHLAVLGIDIFSSENWGKGYGSEAIRVLLDFAFKI